MYLLSIETCFGKFSIALFKGAEVVSYFASLEDTKQAEDLIPAIERLLAKNKLVYSDISKIAVCVGPGSFTGLRIGLAAAKGFELALGVPLIGVTSLQAVIHRKNGAAAYLNASRGDAFYQESANSEPLLIPYDGEFDAPPTAIEVGSYALRTTHNAQIAQPIYVRKVDTKLPHTIKLAKIHAQCFEKGWEPNMFEGLEYIKEQELGFVAYKVVLDECEIKTICVLPQAQRQGIAAKLITQMLKVTNVKNYFLEVEHNNVAAIELYKKLGFVQFWGA